MNEPKETQVAQDPIKMSPVDEVELLEIMKRQRGAVQEKKKKEVESLRKLYYETNIPSMDSDFLWKRLDRAANLMKAIKAIAEPLAEGGSVSNDAMEFAWIADAIATETLQEITAITHSITSRI